LALVAIAAYATPAAAYYWDNSTGITGYVTTTKEVTCKYNAARRLRSFTVHPPSIQGISEDSRTVAWRYQIRGAVEFSGGPLIYKSPWYKDTTTVGVGTTHLTAHTKYIPATSTIPDTTAWYARAIIVWYNADGVTEAGRMWITYGSYALKRGTESRGSNACAFNYDYTFGT
jgi:hypothetical protein